jgi:hypothetical protein
MAQAQSNNTGCGVIAMLFIGAVFILSLFAPNRPEESDRKFYPVDADERFQHEYAKQRFKLEGYSDADSTQAADAIMRFQRAQQK